MATLKRPEQEIKRAQSSRENIEMDDCMAKESGSGSMRRSR